MLVLCVTGLLPTDLLRLPGATHQWLVEWLDFPLRSAGRKAHFLTTPDCVVLPECFGHKTVSKDSVFN